MAASTNATGRVPASKGLLQPEEFARRVRFDEVPASGPAAAWVERVWSASWELPDGMSATTSLIPHPAVEISVERGQLARAGRDRDGVWLTGVVTSRFDVTQFGSGGVLGLKFRPGGFAAWSGIPADQLTDRVEPAGDRLPGMDQLAHLPLVASESASVMLDSVLAGAGSAEPIPALVEDTLALLAEPVLTRVDQLAHRCGCSVRTLQRTIRHYVGVGPKWLIRRQRMHDAVAALDAETGEGLAELAARLGWYDQNQFGRDFVRLVGSTPSAYRDRTRADGTR
ncbi:helix-turn-helix domain-containing protein [Micropruina sp.]|uniref:helix-turn-helix domain-containing protein n=1 Tax=Micropruina sp. TaxID=2737536 RepID=UPI0039E5B9AE